MKIIYEDQLSPTESLRAEYLSALSDYRRLAAEFATALHADLTTLKSAAHRLHTIESNETFIKLQMLPAADAAVHLGYSRAQLTRICRLYGSDGNNQVQCEKRHGKLWYVYVHDIEYLIKIGKLRGPY